MPCLHGDIGARPDGDTDIGRRQRRGVIDAVAHHGHDLALLLHFLDLRGLVLGKDFGEDRIDAELLRDGIGHRLGVARQHGDLDVPLVQRAHGRVALIADPVRDSEQGNSPTVTDEIDGRLTLAGGLVGSAFDFLRHVDALAVEQRRRS